MYDITYDRFLSVGQGMLILWGGGR